MRIITLNQIRDSEPCTEGYQAILKYTKKSKADDVPINLLEILDDLGLQYTLWTIRINWVDNKSMWKEFIRHIYSTVPENNTGNTYLADAHNMQVGVINNLLYQDDAVGATRALALLINLLCLYNKYEDVMQVVELKLRETLCEY